MGNSYACPNLNCDAQRYNYIMDNYKEESWRHKLKPDQLRSIIKLTDLNPYDDFVTFQRLISYRDPDDLEDCRDFKDLNVALHNLKIWSLMRGWDRSIYRSLKSQVKVLYTRQLKSLTHQRHQEQQNTLVQIRQDLLEIMELWIKTNQIHQNLIDYRKFDMDGHLDVLNIKPLSKPPKRNRDWSSNQFVLGWDKIYTSHAVNMSPLVYHVPPDHPTLGGSKLMMKTESYSFTMPGSCMSYGGDSWGGMNNDERNRLERAKSRTSHLVLKFNLELIKF